MSNYDAPDIDEFQAAIHKALASWGDIGSSEEELLGFLLLVQQERAADQGSPDPLAARNATNRVLEDAIDELARQEKTQAAVIRSRFIRGDITRQVAATMHASTDQVNRWQRSAIADLSRILLARERNVRSKRLRELEVDLPPPTYTSLFGFDEAAAMIAGKIGDIGAPWILSITGLGGIGKTSLADASIRLALRSFIFDRAIWLQARSNTLSGAPLSPEESHSQLLKALAEQLWPGEPSEAESDIASKAHELLTATPHLIVIDNLETEESTNYLIDKITPLTQPSKILLTTRARPTNQASVYTHSLDELSLEEASALLHHQAALVGLEELSLASVKDIEAIYAVTGGNPLALKLVVSLAAVLALPQILSDIAKSRPGPVEELYRNIYWESWRTLADNSQSLLQAMPLVAEAGALPEQMRAISRLSEKEFWPAVSELISRSLLEIKGTIHERRYGIHRLTETFLRTEIIGWTEQLES